MQLFTGGMSSAVRGASFLHDL